MLSANQSKEHISKMLASLATKELTVTEQDALSLVIAQLFIDLDSGHSCSELCADIAGLNPGEQVNLLLKSKLAYEYITTNLLLKPLPISILSLTERKLVYITKYLQYELDVLDKIKFLCNSQADTLANIPATGLLHTLSVRSNIPNNEQLCAIENAVKHKFSIITGGPGTGKTTTVALLLWLLYQNYGEELQVRICAPTGKASKRVKSSIQNTLNSGFLSELEFSQVKTLLEKESNFLTIHKLLGYQANSIYFKHNKNNQLNLDVLIIDESSMISLPLFSKLLQAINQTTIKHLILLGDKNQLSSVEEGYVFAAMVNAKNLLPHVTRLIATNRSNKDIARLASLVQDENLVELEVLIKSSSKIKHYRAKLTDLFDKQLFAKVENSLNSYFEYVLQSDLSDIPRLFSEFNRQIVLCLTNVGLFGTVYLNAQIEKQVKYIIVNKYSELSNHDYDLFSPANKPLQIDNIIYANEWYSGRPVIILENDYSLELFNGDIGICIVTDGRVQVVFENGRKFVPAVLPRYQVAYAITIHKSQGSEYEHVNLLLGDNSGIANMGGLLSKELIYTGITRARNSISIFAGDKVLAHAISNKTLRNTGLYLML